MVPCLKHPATKSCLFRLLFVGTTQVHVWPHQKSRGEVDSRGVAEKERNTGRSERGLLSGSPIPRRLEEEGRGERKQGGGLDRNDEESPGLFGKQVWGRGWEEGRGVTKLDCLFTWLP